MKLMHEFSKVIPAPAERVRQLLIGEAFVLRGSGYVVDGNMASSTGHSMKVEADWSRGFFAIQGGWWYRAEYLAQPAPGGTLFTQRIYNAATWGKWAVPLANKFFVGFHAQSRSQFEQLVATLEAAV